MIRLNNYSFTYAKGSLPALSNISFRTNESTVIYGNNASGKTTLLHSICGIIPHVIEGRREGEIFVDGFSPYDISISKCAEKVGIIFQNAESMFFNHTVEDEIIWPLLKKMPKKKARSVVRVTSEKLGISSLLQRNPFSLSEGEKQKVAIACALAAGSDYVLLDEPFTYLDASSKRSLKKVIKNFSKKHTLLISTARKEEMSVDNAIFLDRGRVSKSLKFKKIKFSLPKIAEKNIASLRSVCVGYGKKEVLKNFSADLRNGLVVVRGKNGSGKTTFLKLLNGLLKPFSGKIILFGREVTDSSAPQLFGTVATAFQNPLHQLFLPTVSEEIEFGMKNLNFPEKTIHKSTYLRASQFALAPHLHRFVYELSGGTKKLLTLAAAFSISPKLLIFDEPFAFLDSNNAQIFLRNVEKYIKKGGSVVMATHENIPAHQTIYLGD